MKIGPTPLLLAGAALMVCGLFLVDTQKPAPLSAAAAGASEMGDTVAASPPTLAQPVPVGMAGIPPGSAMVPSGSSTRSDATVRTVRIVVRGGHLVSGPSRVSVSVGAPLAFLVDTDTVDSFEVEGYDVTVPVIPGQVGSIAFAADHPGRFDFGLDHSGVILGSLEVGGP